MTRLPGFAAMLLIVAAGMCPVDKCEDSACTDKATDRIAPDLRPGESFTFSSPTCSTCGHSSAFVEWQSLNPLPGGGVSGTVDVSYQASCPATAFCCQERTQSQPAQVTGRVTFSDVNAKNLCGENSPITYTLTIKNNSTGVINAAHMSITCPTSGKSGSPNSVVSPSALPR